MCLGLNIFALGFRISPDPKSVCVQLYEGEVEPWLMSDNCTENVPILIRRATFCGAFNADARNFQVLPPLNPKP